MTFNTGNIGPVVVFQESKRFLIYQTWLKSRQTHSKISWIMAWRKYLKMCFPSQTSRIQWNWNLWVMKSANLSIRLKKRASTMPATQHQSLWPSVWSTKKQVKSRPKKFSLVISQSWLKWEPLSSMVENGLSYLSWSAHQVSTSMIRWTRMVRLVMDQLLSLTVGLG